MTERIASQPIARSSKSKFSRPVLFLLLSLLAFTATNIYYGENQAEFFTAGASPVFSIVSVVLLSSGAIFLFFAATSYLRVEELAPTRLDSQSRMQITFGKLIGDAIFRKRKVFLISAALYALFFSIVEGILVYQPSVDFASSLGYGISETKAIVETCCGPPGYVPVGLVYFPSQHFGIQLIPVSVMIMVLISTLVGLNVSLLYTALENTKSASGTQTTPFSKKRIAGSALGAVFGLFAGCPTCAAAFFLSTVAGSGATVFSFMIAKFQTEIIALTIPLLVGSILWQAKTIRVFLRGCNI